MSKEEQKTYGKGKYTEKDFKNSSYELESNLDFMLARSDWAEETGRMVEITDEYLDEWLKNYKEGNK